MPKVKQASTRKRKTRAGTLSALGAAGLSLSLAGHAAASTLPNANLPQTDNTAPNQRFVLGEEEMADVSLATFYLFDRENFGGGVQLAHARRGHPEDLADLLERLGADFLRRLPRCTGAHHAHVGLRLRGRGTPATRQQHQSDDK